MPLPFAIPGKADTAFAYTLLIALHIIVMKLIISLLDGATTSKILGLVYAGSHIILSKWVIDGSATRIFWENVETTVLIAWPSA